MTGTGEIYFAPAGTAAPTSTSKESLKAAGWQFLGQTADDVQDGSREFDDRPTLAEAASKHWTLNLTYQLPEPYRPNRAARRAAARAT